MRFLRTRLLLFVLTLAALTGGLFFLVPTVHAQVCTGVCIDIQPPGSIKGGAGGGAGSGFYSPSNLSVSVNSGAACTSSIEAAVYVSFSNAVEIAISLDGDFDNVEWQSLEGASDQENIVRGRNQEVVRFAMIPFEFDRADGPKEVFVRFRSISRNVSGIYSDTIFLDQADLCRRFEEGGEDPSIDACEAIQRGSYMKLKSTPTVYYVTEECVRRPFISASTYFTYERTYDPVAIVADRDLASVPLGYPMLPKPGTILVKLSDSPRVYYIEESEDPNSAVLRWIVDEDTARVNFGENWQYYLLDLHPGIYPRFTFGSNIVSDEYSDRRGELIQAIQLAPDKFTSDTDGDGLFDYDELIFGSDPRHADTDVDGLTDYWEKVHGTDPRSVDTDADGFTDYDEVQSGFNPVGGGVLDTDGDGLTDPEEIQLGTDRYSKDSDGDGYNDARELLHGFDPLGPGVLPREVTGFSPFRQTLAQVENVLYRLRSLLPF